MGPSEIAAIIAAVGGVLTGLAGIVFGYLGKRAERSRTTAEQDAKDVVTLNERIDELERRLDVVVRAYFDQRQAVTVGGHSELLLDPPPEMRRAVPS